MERKLAQTLEPIYRKMWECTPEHPSKGKAMLCPQWGNNWNDNGIMMVGKATNGWGDEPSTIFSNGQIEKKARDYSWILKCYYTPVNDNGWRGSRSAFFRTQKKICARIFPDFEEKWAHHLVFTDLYKIAPRYDGNPTNKMINAQHDLCVESLRKEIEIFAPRAVVFLTSGWEAPFVKVIMGDDFFNQLKTIGEGNTACRYGFWNGCKIICTSHPQGKRESEIVENVVSILAM